MELNKLLKLIRKKMCSQDGSKRFYWNKKRKKKYCRFCGSKHYLQIPHRFATEVNFSLACFHVRIIHFSGM